ncbi:MAG: hypothetical protein M1812_006951 [Candelaria pacifica]|nr:MAG: hypothetical protein M1812_006951 [Candelaria pacifica]
MADLAHLAHNLLTSGPHKLEPTDRRIRIFFNGTYIVDTLAARHVWEHPYFPQYYVPKSEVKGGALSIGDVVAETPKDQRGLARVGNLKVGGKDTDRVLLFEGEGKLGGLVRFEFGAMDAWYEEDMEIFVHPKDPYKRIDILPSQRPVKVEVDGKVIAESISSMHLHETGLPTRFYLPKTSVNWEYLTPSYTISKCPYKGEANYYNVQVNNKTHRDLVWWYKTPTSESLAIAGLVCFYNEKVDTTLDGKRLERPKSKFA